MNLFTQRIRAVYRKELLEILRDRRTLTAMIVVPIALYPLLMVVFANAAGEQATQIVAEVFVVGVKQQGDFDKLKEAAVADCIALFEEQGITPHPDFPLEQQPVMPDGQVVEMQPYVVPDGDLERAVREQKIHVGVELLPQQTKANGQIQLPLRIYSLDEWIRSRAAALRLGAMADRINQRERPNLIQVSNVSMTNETSILSVILPLILILMTITGAIYPAIDLTAGERERGTLESLMVCPVPVRDLIAGKFLVVTTVAIGGAALNLASVSATVYFGGFAGLIQQREQVQSAVGSVERDTVSDADADSEGSIKTESPKPVRTRPQFPWYVLPIILVALIPFALLMSAIMLAVSAAARTFKEAQNYVTPVILGVLLPGGVAALPGTELTGTNLVMPVANMVLLTRDLLREPTVVPFASIAWVLMSTTLYAVAAIAVATRVFGNEAVVFSDSGSVKTLFMRRFFKPRDYPNRTTVWLILAVLLPIWFYVQNGLALADPENFVGLLRGTALLMPVFFVILPAAALYYWKVDLLKALGLQRPRVTDLLAGLLIGITAWIPTRELVLWMQSVFGLPASLEKLDELFQTSLQQFPPAMGLLIIAIIPGLCEELLFRGMLLHALRPTVKRAMAVILTAAVFGAFHMSFFRFPITFALGLAFGYLCWQSRSVWPAIIAHVLHNGIGVSQTLWPGWQGRLYPRLADESGHVPIEVILVGGLIMLAGFALVTRPRKSP